MQTIIIEKPTTVNDEYNEPTVIWSHFLKSRVQVRMVTENTTKHSNKKVESSIFTFSIKPTPKVLKVTTDYRILFESNIYTIFGIDGIDELGYINIRAQS